MTASFESLVAFRHLHAFRFGRGDIYNVCVLRAAPGAAAQPLRPQAEEIAQVRWAPLREVFAYPHLRAWMPLVQVRLVLRFCNFPTMSQSLRDSPLFIDAFACSYIKIPMSCVCAIAARRRARGAAHVSRPVAAARRRASGAHSARGRRAMAGRDVRHVCHRTDQEGVTRCVSLGFYI